MSNHQDEGEPLSDADRKARDAVAKSDEVQRISAETDRKLTPQKPSGLPSIAKWLRGRA
jgi:hypothetical protein